MPDFHGARVALLEARFGDDTAAMVQRLGGEPVLAPALREVACAVPDLKRSFVWPLAAAADPVVICLTGAGVRALFDRADDQGCGPELMAALASATTVCRGPKPAGVLAARALPVTTRVDEPFTTVEVVRALALLDLRKRFVALLHYGEPNEPLATWLRERGADLRELMLYEWRLPEDLAPLDRLIDELTAGRIDAVAFTSQVQLRHLLEVAGPRAVSLIETLANRTLVGAIGPTCAAALQAAGIQPAVVASPPKLAQLLRTLAAAIERRSMQ